MEYLERSEEIVGYRVKIMHREAFKIKGYTLIVPPNADDRFVSRFWDAVSADGRLEKLLKASSIRPWALGLGSWDEECEKHGFRYTICIEETEHTDFSSLAQEYPLYTQELGASDWMCFEMTERKYTEQFWKDNPYVMMKKLGYRFNGRVGVHFDAYPPDPGPANDPVMEFWITVAKSLKRP